VKRGAAEKRSQTHVAGFLPFPLRATLEETLKRLEELPGRVRMIDPQMRQPPGDGRNSRRPSETMSAIWPRPRVSPLDQASSDPLHVSPPACVEPNPSLVETGRNLVIKSPTKASSVTWSRYEKAR
jgi:hypothetical protein